MEAQVKYKKPPAPTVSMAVDTQLKRVGFRVGVRVASIPQRLVSSVTWNLEFGVPPIKSYV